MKTTKSLILILVAFQSLLCLSCVTTTTTTTAPDGTVVVVKTTAPAPGSVEAASAVAAKVVAEK